MKIIERFFSNYFFILIILCYGGSLFLPGIVIKKENLSSPKYSFCEGIIRYGFECRPYIEGDAVNAKPERVVQGIGIDFCGRSDGQAYRVGVKQIKTVVPAVDRSLLVNYCGNDWNATEDVSEVISGWIIFLTGVSGIFVGNFAWFANPLLLFAWGCLFMQSFKWGKRLAIIAFLVALQAFFLKEVPRDAAGNIYNTVEYLGAGYYVWLGSIVLTIVYAFNFFRPQANKSTDIVNNQATSKEAPFLNDNTVIENTKYAGLSIRFRALFIDSFIVSCVVMGIAFAINAVNNWALGLSREEIRRTTLYPYLLSFVIYSTLLTYTKGATLGKRALKIRVVSADGQKLSLKQVILRETLGKFLSGIFLNIGFIVAGFTERKQALHDKVAKTYVVYSDKN
jgi:uncharacterized RDD family membrane protein YckC